MSEFLHIPQEILHQMDVHVPRHHATKLAACSTQLFTMYTDILQLAEQIDAKHQDTYKLQRLNKHIATEGIDRSTVALQGPLLRSVISEPIAGCEAYDIVGKCDSTESRRYVQAMEDILQQHNTWYNDIAHTLQYKFQDATQLLTTVCDTLDQIQTDVERRISQLKYDGKFTGTRTSAAVLQQQYEQLNICRDAFRGYSLEAPEFTEEEETVTTPITESEVMQYLGVMDRSRRFVDMVLTKMITKHPKLESLLLSPTVATEMQQVLTPLVTAQKFVALFYRTEQALSTVL